MLVTILDTSAFIQGYNPTNSEIEQYTVPFVYAEIHEEIARLRYESARSSGQLKERVPSAKSMDVIEQIATQSGEAHFLSNTDKQILSLALDLKSEGKNPVIISDDYSVQNMAQKLRFKFQARGTKGIKKEINWVIYCPGCKKKFNILSTDNKCPICGTQLKRKPKKQIFYKQI